MRGFLFFSFPGDVTAIRVTVDDYGQVCKSMFRMNSNFKISFNNSFIYLDIDFPSAGSLHATTAGF